MSSVSYIRVKVKYIPQIFQSVTKTEEEELVIEEDSTLANLLMKISCIHKGLSNWLITDNGKLNENILVIVNKRVEWDFSKRLKDGDEVILTIPFDGG